MKKDKDREIFAFIIRYIGLGSIELLNSGVRFAAIRPYQAEISVLLRLRG